MNAATQAMNHATQRMAKYAFWSTIFVVFGTALLTGTLYLTSKATADAARAYAVDRVAHLTLEVVQPKCMDWLREGGEVPAMTCVIKNSGRGPAVVIQVCRKWLCCHKGEYPIPASDDGTGKEFAVPIGPQGESAKLYSLSQEPKLMIGANQRVYFWGFVDYKDAGGAKFRSAFCYVARPDRADIGFHVAFVANPEKYWYHKQLS